MSREGCHLPAGCIPSVLGTGSLGQAWFPMLSVFLFKAKLKTYTGKLVELGGGP